MHLLPIAEMSRTSENQHNGFEAGSRCICKLRRLSGWHNVRCLQAAYSSSQTQRTVALRPRVLIGKKSPNPTFIATSNALWPRWHFPLGEEQRRPPKPKHAWTIQVRLELTASHLDLALSNMALDSKLRGWDLMRMTVAEFMATGQIRELATCASFRCCGSIRRWIAQRVIWALKLEMH